MRLRASNVALTPRERVEILRPGNLRAQYEAIARGTGIFLLLPGAMLVLMVLFLMPFWFGAYTIAIACSFLHVVLLLAVLAVINAMERPIVALLWRGVWPMHRWWLAHHDPARLELVVHRDIGHREEPSSVHLDEESGHLVAGPRHVNLSQPFELSVERCEVPERRLRVRVHNIGGDQGIVLCTNLPYTFIRFWESRVEPLPRIESDATRLEWGDFWRLLAAIRPFGLANGSGWPPVLSTVVR